MPEDPLLSLVTPAEPVLVLCLDNPDGPTAGGFRWPESGPVVGPASTGLFGWLWGEGRYYAHPGAPIGPNSPTVRWLVVRVASYQVLAGVITFVTGEVRHSGDQRSATAYLATRGGAGRAIIGATVTAKSYGTVTVGDWGMASAGYKGTATTGDYGTAIVGEFGTAAAGYQGTATADSEGTAHTGDRGTARAGSFGTATTGDFGTARADYKGTVSAGESGNLLLEYSDGQRSYLRAGAIGVDHDAAGHLLRPKQAYQLDAEGRFVPLNTPPTGSGSA